MIKGFKAFNRNLQCRGFQFKEGETYELKDSPKICSRGFHFCSAIPFTLEYYPVSVCVTENLYAEIEAIGETVFEDSTKHKGCTNKIKIIKVYSDSEILKIFDKNQNNGDQNNGYRNNGDQNNGSRNNGSQNNGYRNNGDQNNGDRNNGDQNNGSRNNGSQNNGYRNNGSQNNGSQNNGYRNNGSQNNGDQNNGDQNNGDQNNGYRNNGDQNNGSRNNGSQNNGDQNNGSRNNGDQNNGDQNNGDQNNGYRNNGYRNNGDRNNGSWNCINNESGHFNSKQLKTIRVFNKNCSIKKWLEAEKPNFLYFDLLPGKSYQESFQESFKKADENQIKLLKKLPNFNAKVFFEISGIDLRVKKTTKKRKAKK